MRDRLLRPLVPAAAEELRYLVLQRLLQDQPRSQPTDRLDRVLRLVDAGQRFIQLHAKPLARGYSRHTGVPPLLGLVRSKRRLRPPLQFPRILRRDLPTTDLSLHVTLPELITPELQRLRDAIADDEPDHGWDELTIVTNQIDTPQQRARLADALVSLRDRNRVRPTQAAYGIYDLSTTSQRLLAASVTHTISVEVGASRTPGGLQIAA